MASRKGPKSKAGVRAAAQIPAKTTTTTPPAERQGLVPELPPGRGAGGRSGTW